MKTPRTLRRRVPRERNGPSTEGRILHAAENLFARHGFDGVSINQLAAEAKVTIGALYHHFSSKEALYAAATKRVFTAKSHPPPEVLQPKGTARARLVRLVAWFVGAMVLDRNFGLLLRREFMDPRPSTPALAGEDIFAAQLTLCRDLLGQLLPGANSDEAVAIMLALLFGFTNMKGLRAVLPGIGKDFGRPEVIAERVVGLLVHGLRVRKAARR